MKKILTGILLTFMILQSSVFAERSKITILYTNDIHTHIDNKIKDSSKNMVPGLTYASVSALKKELSDSGENVVLVDSGDFSQGTIYGAEDKGKTIIQLMNDSGFDVATIGNHEFDYGMSVLLENIRKAKFPVVACNFFKGSKLITKPYAIIEKGNTKIAFIGIATPESLTKASPAIFMDKNKDKVIYNFSEDSTGDKLVRTIQMAIDDAKTKGKADYVVALGHLGIDESSKPYRSIDVIQKISGLDAFIDGHSHSVVEHQIVKDREGKDVVLSQTGCYLSSIGKMVLEGNDIQTQLITEYEKKDEFIESKTNSFVKDIDSKMGESFAVNDVNFVMRTDDGSDWFVRKHETNLGDFVADSIYYYINEIEKMPCDIVFMNGGGIRENIPAGSFSYKTAKTVQPFGNQVCILNIDGQTVLDVLEFGSRGAGKDAIGGFMQVAGLKFSVDTSVPSTVQIDSKKMWGGKPSAYRVHNVEVYNINEKKYEPLDLNKKYCIGGINFIIRNMGDGFKMFKNAELVKDYIGEDYIMMCEYAKAFDGKDSNGLPHINTKNSPLQNYPGYLLNYDTPKGSGRIELK